MPLVASLTATETLPGEEVFQPLSPVVVWLTVIVGFVWSSVIESVAVVERLPASSLYWTQTVFEPSPEGRVWPGLALYGETTAKGVTKVALEQSAPLATR